MTLGAIAHAVRSLITGLPMASAEDDIDMTTGTTPCPIITHQWHNDTDHSPLTENLPLKNINYCQLSPVHVQTKCGEWSRQVDSENDCGCQVRFVVEWWDF